MHSWGSVLGEAEPDELLLKAAVGIPTLCIPPGDGERQRKL